MGTLLVETQSTKRELFNDEDAIALLDHVIGGLRLSGRSLTHLSRASDGWPLLHFLYHNGYVTREQLEGVVHRKLIDFGLIQKDYVKASENYADHCASPDALGYAMRYEWEQYASEWEHILLDDDETVGDYIQKADGLLEAVIQQMLAEGNQG